MARPYGEGIVFNILMKVLYIAYLAMYMAYAVLNYIAETGNDFVNFIVITFISVSIVIFVIANVLDWVYKNADARSKIKVRLHTLRNMFKIIKVGVSILVLAQTISDDSWNALTITMLVISLPTSLIWLLGEYVYVAIAGIFRRKGRKNSAEDADEEYDDAARVTPVHDTIERVKQFAESELIVLRPHEVDYDSDEQEDVNDGYLGYEEDDDFSYPPALAVTAQDEKREYTEYQGAFCVEEIPLEGEPRQVDTGAEREDWSIEEVIEEAPQEESAPAAEESAPEEEQASQDATQEESAPTAEESASEDEQASQDTMQEESASEQEVSAPEEEQASQDTTQEESAPTAEESTPSEQEESTPEEEQASQDITQEESAQAAEESAAEQERESASEQEENASEEEQASQDTTQEESAPTAEESASEQEESVPVAEESAPDEERESTEQEAEGAAQEGSGDNE